MVSITSADVQHEIITCLPEVVDDTEHTGVALQLKLVEPILSKVEALLLTTPS